jgi:hypothetical protein
MLLGEKLGVESENQCSHRGEFYPGTDGEQVPGSLQNDMPAIWKRKPLAEHKQESHS